MLLFKNYFCTIGMMSLINFTKKNSLNNELKHNKMLTNYFSLSINSKVSLFFLFLHDVIHNNKQIDISELTDAYIYQLWY